MSSNIKRLIGALIFFIWMAFVVAAFYVVQKPMLLDVVKGLADTIWTLLITALLGANAVGLGYVLIQKFGSNLTSATERILLGLGLGLGFTGLLGFLFGALGITNPVLLFVFQAGIGLLFLWQGVWRSVFDDLIRIKTRWAHFSSDIPLYIKIAFGLVITFAFLLALAPPIEGFDSLSYHLLAPSKIIEDGGILPHDVYAFWHPGLVEANFFWGIGLGSDRLPQLLHVGWAVAGVLLVVYWALTNWKMTTAQKTILIILSLPSFYRLASWAYSDLALAFYITAALYAVVKWLQQEEQPKPFWLVLAGAMTGFAMGIKYTSFTLPISIVLIILFFGRKKVISSFKWIMSFGLIAGVIALPWYLRNWIVMDNPIYPFVFGGLYWDDFRMNFYANPGSGIGFDIVELLLLPLNATLGHRDVTFYGGRIGPVFLLFLPFTVYAVIKSRRAPSHQRKAVFSIALFCLLSSLVWVIGVVNTAHLWETRYLYPTIIVFSLLTALGWQASVKLDTPNLRLSFIVNIIVGLIITITVIDAGLTVITRNPLAFALGLETRESYLHKVQPAYAEAMQILNETPSDAKIYFLFEPRSYYAERVTQEDLILDNLAHDLYVSGSPDQVLASWINQGYTHVLLYRRGIDYLAENRTDSFQPEHQAALEYIIQNYLDLVGTTEDGAYELYKIKK